MRPADCATYANGESVVPIIQSVRVANKHEERPSAMMLHSQGIGADVCRIDGHEGGR